MLQRLFSKFLLAAAVAALALSLTPTASTAAGERGFCTGYVNAFNWGHKHWRTATGAVFPTIFWCYRDHCPPPC